MPGAARILQCLSSRISTPSTVVMVRRVCFVAQILPEKPERSGEPREPAAGLAAAALHSTVGCRQSIAVPPKRTSRIVAQTHHFEQASVPSVASRPARALSQDQEQSSSEAGGEQTARRRNAFQTDFASKTRQPFRRCTLCPAPPVARRQVDHCLAVPLLALAGHFYLGHAPPLRHLKHPDDFFRAPVTTPAAAVVPVLSLTFVPSVTSLVGVTPRTQCCMSAPSGTA